MVSAGVRDDPEKWPPEKRPAPRAAAGASATGRDWIGTGAAKPSSPAALPRARRWAVYFVGAGLWLSGALWLAFHYFLQIEGPFGTRPHPLESWWLPLHAGFGFASLWVLGLLWGVHVGRAWPTRLKRWSGSFMLGALGVLVASGYLLYYLGNDALRADTALLHWILGLACPTVFLLHRRAVRAAQPEAVLRSASHSAISRPLSEG
jgi:hypothetical protein